MENKKSYPANNVTISTEEYRDLIAESASAKRDADRYATNYWAEHTKAEKLQKDLDAVTAENAALTGNLFCLKCLTASFVRTYHPLMERSSADAYGNGTEQGCVHQDRKGAEDSCNHQ